MVGAIGLTGLGRDKSEEELHQPLWSRKSRLDHPRPPEAVVSAVEGLASEPDLSPPETAEAELELAALENVAVEVAPPEEAALMLAGSDAARLRPENKHIRPPARRKLLRKPWESGVAGFILSE
jgi:hypothetical protein